MVAIANKNSEYHCQRQQETDPNYNAEMETENYYEEIQAPVGLANTKNECIVQHMLARQINWKELLNDRYKHACLHAALKRLKGQAH